MRYIAWQETELIRRCCA